QSVKFVDLMEVAQDLGADVLATGHYVQSRLENGRRRLYRPVDASRDQSYFLFATTKEQLDFLRFPLGGMSKPAVRELARDFGLEVADKHDSQDICFGPQGSPRHRRTARGADHEDGKTSRRELAWRHHELFPGCVRKRVAGRSKGALDPATAVGCGAARRWRAAG